MQQHSKMTQGGSSLHYTIIRKMFKGAYKLNCAMIGKSIH